MSHHSFFSLSLCIRVLIAAIAFTLLISAKPLGTGDVRFEVQTSSSSDIAIVQREARFKKNTESIFTADTSIDHTAFYLSASAFFEARDHNTLVSDPSNFVTFDTVTWVGGSGNWDVASNWSPHLPNSGDSVVINSGTVSCPSGCSGSLNSLTLISATLNIVSGGPSAATGTISGGTAINLLSGASINFNILSVTGSLNISGGSLGGGQLNLNGATININATDTTGLLASTCQATSGNVVNLTIGKFSIFDTLNVSGTLDVLGGNPINPNFTSSTLVVGGTLNVIGGRFSFLTTNIPLAGTVNINSSGNLGFTVNNSGNLILEGNTSIGAQALNNLTGGIIDVRGDIFFNDPAPGYPLVFNNAGTFYKTAGQGTCSFNGQFNNNWVVQVDSGKLSLKKGGVSNGFFTTGGAGSDIIFLGNGHTLSGNFFGTATIQGPVTFGPAYFADGFTLSIVENYTTFTSNVEVPVVNLNIPGMGGIQGSGNLTVTNTLNWTKGTMEGAGSTNISPGATLNFLGTLGQGISRTINNSGVAIQSHTGAFDTIGFFNGTFNNLPGSIFELRSDRGIGGGSGTNVFNNAGTLRKSVGTGTSTVAVPFNNSGIVEGQTGSLSFSGTYTQTAGSTFLNGGSFSKPSGTLNIQGGTIRGIGTINGSVNNTGGIVRPGTSPGCLSINGTYLQGASGTLDIEIGGTTPCSGFDKLTVSGGATLAGTLSASLVNGYIPAVGLPFQVLGYGSFTGAFKTVNMPFSATYNPTNLTVGLSGTPTPTNSPTGTQSPTPTKTPTNTPTTTPTATATATATPTPNTELVSYVAANYKYKQIGQAETPPAGFQQPTFDDSLWATGSAAFGNVTGCPLQGTEHSPWSSNTRLLVRKQISVPQNASNLNIYVAIDNDVVAVYFNGVQVGGNNSWSGCAARDSFVYSVPNALLQAGTNLITYHLSDSGFGVYFDTRVAAYVPPNTPTNTPTYTPTSTATNTATATATATPTPITYSNTTPITINAIGAGTPYPSNLGASGFVNISAPNSTVITKVTVDLIGVSHTNPDDMDIMLVSPSGQNAIIMSDVGGSSKMAALNLTLDDGAAASLPDETQIVSGTFKPTNFDLSSDAFPAPAPASSAGSALSVFNGTDPNGTWSLYVYDDQSGEAGSISGGWTLNITTSVGTINGTVTYGNASAPPKYISNVTVTGTGSPNVFTTTAAPGGTAGQYTLTGFGAGSYTVSLSKTTGQNSITSNDAARIAAHVTGANLLTTDNQKVSADVTGNGAISSQDAAKIAQVVAGLPFSPPNLTGTWKFFLPPGPTFPIGASPTSRTYSSITSNITGDDYVGLLIGEVTGNWVPSAARPAAEPQSSDEEVTEKQSFSANRTAEPWAGRDARVPTGPERGIGVELPDVSVDAGKEVAIPVNVESVSDKGVISYEFDLRYDPSVIQPVADIADVKGTASRGLSVVTNATEPGLLRVVVYGALPIDEDGVLMNLRFTAVGKPGSVSPLSFERMMFNEGEPRVSVLDGKVELF